MLRSVHALWMALVSSSSVNFPSATSLAASLRRERFHLLQSFDMALELNFTTSGSGASAVGFVVRFFLLVATSAILFSEFRLTPRARVSSFNSLKSFSSSAEIDE
jgi:hypothetical protein